MRRPEKAPGSAPKERGVPKRVQAGLLFLANPKGRQRSQPGAGYPNPVVDVNHGLAAEAEERYRGMGTTALVCWILLSQRSFWVGHIGNSRAYLFRAGQLQRLTEDHTLLNEIRRAGKLPQSDEQLPPPNVLSQALGRGAALAPQIIHHDVQSGDRILLCTDGVSDVLTDEEIAQTLRKENQPDETCEEIAQNVERKGAPDNLTVILIEILPDATMNSQRIFAVQKEVTP